MMGWTTRNYLTSVYFLCTLIMFLSGILEMSSARLTGNQQQCGKSCLKCDSKVPGQNGTVEARCVKCSHLIVLHTRRCVDECPPGYSEEWSSLVDYMGRVCRESLFLGGIALSGQTLAVVVGALVGTVICFVLVLVAGICLKYRRYRAMRAKARDSLSLSHLTGTQRSQDSDDSERPEFLKHLASLRPDAPIFLAMLNETRRQVRDLRKPSRQDSAIQAYKPVLKDLSRILILLNRREERIGSPPADWETLLAWGERVLRRYKKQNPHQVAQLVSFLQVPVQTHPTPSPPASHSPYPSQLTTFVPVDKRDSSAATTPSPVAMATTRIAPDFQQLAISAFDDNYNNRSSNRKSEDELRRNTAASMLQQPSLIDSGVDFSSNWEFNPSNYTILAEWSAAAADNSPTEYAEFGNNDEDDFFTLGFRPQDEITTEL
ncbi:FU domain-containing protein T48 [Lycorma delicatula]|uniref:FU domain-containing protein T48 n=1 Tax=Lycorma delicatula TaxID=130591 RepID=UPI003F51706B